MSSSSPALSPYPFLRLMRLHQPTGIWLVYWPCVWSLALAGVLHFNLTGEMQTGHVLWFSLWFLFGAVVMRSAGCIVNDMADREFDKHVERTRLRPLASGELQPRQAMILLALLCLAGLGILGVTFATLPEHSQGFTLLVTALPVTVLIVAYPFMKRITWWPQAFLGITFNWGVLISWVAIRGQIDVAALWLYAACLFWTLAYDTIYGHQDKRDDEKIGIKSTSRLLERHRLGWVSGFYGMMLLCYAIATMMISSVDMGGLAIIGGFAAYRLRRTDFDVPASCGAMFRANGHMGLWLALWNLSRYILHIG